MADGEKQDSRTQSSTVRSPSDARVLPMVMHKARPYELGGLAFMTYCGKRIHDSAGYVQSSYADEWIDVTCVACHGSFRGEVAVQSKEVPVAASTTEAVYGFLRWAHTNNLHLRYGRIQFDTSDLAELVNDFARSAYAKPAALAAKAAAPAPKSGVVWEILCEKQWLAVDEAASLLRDFLDFIEVTTHQELMTHGTGMPLNTKFWVEEYLGAKRTSTRSKPSGDAKGR